MRVVVHIDRLVLEGMAVTPAEAARSGAAAQAELTRLLANGKLPAGLRSGAGPERLVAPGLTLAQGGGPERLGRQIARSVHAGLGVDT